MSSLQSKPVPNLIQGVSQQASQQRRDSQCEEQFDCINSPKDGAVARNGLELAKNILADFSDCWTHELYRGNEHYLLVLKNGVVRAFNLDSNVECTVTVASDSTAAYLANTTGVYADKYAYRAQTVDDYTFLAKRLTPPAMATALTPARPKEALFFFKAGAYYANYAIYIIYDKGDGNGPIRYKWSYQTPDNSSVINTPYIATSQICATFFRAMTGNLAPTDLDDYNGEYTGDGGGSGCAYGQNGTNDTSPHFQSVLRAPNGTATALGFSLAIKGNILRLWRTDGVDFQVDTSDGQGGQDLVAFKDTVDSLTSLPKGGFNGFQLAVQALEKNTNQSAEFYVAYTSTSATTGSWQECAAQGTKYHLDPATMPHAIINTGLNTFLVRELVWDDRINGDGITTAKDPGFIGKGIEEMFYDQQRLCIMTESTATYSKARNVFTFFPDTVQTILPDAPIDIQLAGSEAVAILRKSLQIDEGTFLWAQRAQFRVTQGNNTTFQQDTIQVPPSTAYEFSENANFAKVASSMYFATEQSNFSTIRNLLFSNSRPAGDTDVTSHVAAYIPTGIKQLVPSDTGQLVFVTTDGDPSSMYLYNYLVQSQQVVQSAWNKWRLPAGVVLWASVRATTLYVLLQRAGGECLFCKVALSTADVDDITAKDTYRTRLDLRVDETQCTVAYSGVTGLTTVTLPYHLGANEMPVMAIRKTHQRIRGRQVTTTVASSNSFTVKGDYSAEQFYVGLTVRSERTESEFYIRGDQGVTPTDRLNVREFHVSYAYTGYTRLEASQGANRPAKVAQMSNLTIGTSDAVLGQVPPVVGGELAITCDTLSKDLRVTTINDSFLPSRWQTAEWRYEATVRASGGGLGSSKKAA